MKFRIERTSGLSGDESAPCDDAKYEDCEGWVIELSTLDELVKFSHKHGNIIVSSPDNSHFDAISPISVLLNGHNRDGPLPMLEIYDVYRE